MNIMNKPVIIGFYGKSNSGKTTLISNVIKILKKDWVFILLIEKKK